MMRVAKCAATRCEAAGELKQVLQKKKEEKRCQMPRVALVGRPNVGKSALFNRITDGGAAIVHDEPGVTRDRAYMDAVWEGRKFTAVDTGGVLRMGGGDAKLAMQESHVAVLVVDGQQGVTQADRDIAQWLRRDFPKLPVLLAVNKDPPSKTSDWQNSSLKRDERASLS
eukprot:jgi/Pico_ML_1/51560/g2565.t2